MASDQPPESCVPHPAGPARQPARSLGRALRFLVLYPLVAAASYFLTVYFMRPPATGGLRPGQPAPPIVAAGWLNGDAPTSGDLAGKVVVIEAWFAACENCPKAAAKFVHAYKRFHEQGVVFIGLSPDEEVDLPDCRLFLLQTGITWPNGYGAADTLDAYLTDGPYYPAGWIIGADGKIAWNEDSALKLEDAIEQALVEAREK